MAGNDASAIEEPYLSQVQALYRGLVTNLGDAPVSHRTEAECVQVFTTGLNFAKRARDLALGVVGAPGPGAAARRKRSR